MDDGVDELGFWKGGILLFFSVPLSRGIGSTSFFWDF